MDGGPPAGRCPGLCYLNTTVQRLEFHLETACTARCGFCSEAGRMSEFAGFRVRPGDVHAAIRRWAPRGLRSVHFTGGEPTLHRDLPALLATCRTLGLRTGLGSNGHRLADPRYARTVAPLLDDVMVSVHGPTPEVHDRLVNRAGSHARALAAIRALAATRAPSPGRGVAVAANVVVTRDTAARVSETVALAVGAGAGFVLVSQVAPEGAALDGYAELAVPNGRVPALARDAVAAASGRAVVRFFGFPACTLAEARWLSNDLYFSPRVTVEWADDGRGPRLVDVLSLRPDRGRAPVAACGRCSWAGACPGPFVHHARLLGVDGIAPLGASTRGA